VNAVRAKLRLAMVPLVVVASQALDLQDSAVLGTTIGGEYDNNTTSARSNRAAVSLPSGFEPPP
jgi:hypothetical protein